MIFNEIYGCYYQAVAKIIGVAIDGGLTEKKMQEIASEYAFEESFLTIVPALKNQDWQLIDREYGTPIQHKPTMPMTTLERRWLKTILLDLRVRLFQIPMENLEEVEPLFLPEDMVYFDRYQDGDAYEEPTYQEHFHRIYQAMKEHRKIKVRFFSGKNQEKTYVVCPLKLEYSDKEDKFRVLCAGNHSNVTINMGRIIECTLLDETFSEAESTFSRTTKQLVFELIDERNALERAMMRFAHHKKEVTRLDDKTYHVVMEYDVEDETDMVIQMMSFGTYIKVMGPEEIKEELKKRIERQLSMLNW